MGAFGRPDVIQQQHRTVSGNAVDNQGYMNVDMNSIINTVNWIKSVKKKNADIDWLIKNTGISSDAAHNLPEDEITEYRRQLDPEQQKLDTLYRESTNKTTEEGLSSVTEPRARTENEIVGQGQGAFRPETPVQEPVLPKSFIKAVTALGGVKNATGAINQTGMQNLLSGLPAAGAPTAPVRDKFTLENVLADEVQRGGLTIQDALDMANKRNKSETYTGEDKYVEDKSKEWEAANPGKKTPAGMTSKWRLEHKRTTVEELGQKEGIKNLMDITLNELPKYRETASKQVGNIPRIDRAIELIDSPGGVTGKGGYWKSLFAPYAEVLGYSEEEMKNYSDAQLYQVLTRLIVGPMRLEIIGPGPVAVYEQELMQKVSGGGATAKAAARELLGYYKQQAQLPIDTYNTMVGSATKLVPAVGDTWKPLEVTKQKAAPATDVKKMTDAELQKRIQELQKR